MANTMNPSKMSASSMMLLGPVKFTVSGAAYEQLQRTTQYTWAKQHRLGHRGLTRVGAGGPALQYISPGDDTITLNGTMYPEFNGGPLELTFIRLAASIGMPLPLLAGSGLVLGLWVIESVTETDSVFFSDGTARKVGFSLSLRSYSADALM